MRSAGGIVAIVAGSVTGLLVVFWKWRRLPQALAMALLAACGALVAVGALTVQEHAGAGDWAIAIGALAVLTPIHARLVFGRPGTPR